MTSMPRLALAASALLVTALPAAGPADSPRQLTFEQRVSAQRAIERVYYSHQEGTTRSFDQAVPREVLEEKVRTYLKQSVALEKYWRTPVTAEALRREMERIETGSAYPNRLHEVYEALGGDAFLIQETLARATLVSRLSRNFFAFDDRIHHQERVEAEDLHQQLLVGQLSVEAAHPRRQVIEKPDSDALESATFAEPIELAARSPLTLTQGRPAAIGRLTEEREAFVTRVVLSDDGETSRIAEYRVPKRSWQEWWQEAAGGFDESEAHQVASGRVPSRAEPRRHGKEPVESIEPPSVPTTQCRAEDSWDNGSLDDAPEPLFFHQAVWTGAEMIVWASGRGFGYDPVLDTWRRLSMQGVPRGRYAFWTGSEVLVWNGGSDCGGRYDPRRETWTPISCVGAPPYGLAVWTGTEMLVWRSSVSPGARYNARTDKWTPLAVGGPVGNGASGTVWTGTEMIVWGYPAGARYRPATDTWIPTSPLSLPDTDCSLRFNPVWTGREMLAWGISDRNCDFIPGEGGRYDPATDTWSLMATENAWAGYGTVIWTGRHMIIWSGYDGVEGNVDDGARYSPESNSWTRTTRVNAPEGRDFHSAVWTGDSMIAWGGRTFEGDHWLNSGGRYDPVTDTWTPTSTSNGAPVLSNHTSVWTGTEMVVWGGGPGNRYDPITDSWRSTASSGAPPGNGRAVWTGSEMLVWSGANRSQPGPLVPPAEGARYDPVADTWRPMSSVGAPMGYADGTVVWTGTEMIVWGTDFTATCCPSHDTGGRYNPVSDSWLPVSTVDAPPPSERHQAVWTGRQMLIWGGSTNTIPRLRAAGRYNPLTDTWATISEVNEPTLWWGRRGAASVWTGQEMIVWSWDAQKGPAAYSPNTNSWRPISVTGAPEGLDGPAAVWTGTEMIVWGLGGGRYDPATDSWRLLSAAGQPTPRWRHSAVWADTEMIVWGGEIFAEESAVASGGRYFPYGEDADDDADGVTVCGGDCHDGDPGINPNAVELPGNAVDENCDGTLSCDPSAAWRNRGQLVSCVVRECDRLARAGLLSASRCREVLTR